MADSISIFPKSPGELAFERYAVAVGGVNYAGEPLKPYGELSDTIKAGWEAAGPKQIDFSAGEWKIIRRALEAHRDLPGKRSDGRLYVIARLAEALRIEVN